VQPVHRFGTTTSWYRSCHCVLSADEAIVPQYRGWVLMTSTRVYGARDDRPAKAGPMIRSYYRSDQNDEAGRQEER
jgi:hypothetical protein